ncbi:MAG: WYL domain-containing protein [Ruminiclostridium sp.]|nr:WYL domain-containing protein [Ruminiclostridium sp.]
MEHERIIQIYDYLCRNTDEEHSVSCRDIQDHLARNSNLRNVSPLTIRRDIDRLCAAGNDIRRINGPHNTALYSLIDKGFTFNEIRFMVDSISINKFLSAEQKKKLIHKFEGMCTEAEIRNLISRISLGSAAAPSLDLLENLDKIHRIISERRKINFQYGKFDTKKQMNYYSKSREMIPVRVVYFDEHFYLRCFNEETEQFRTYRIDRMKDIAGGGKSRKKIPDDKKYNGFVVDMFAPEHFEFVTMRVKRYLLDEMLEQLGEFGSFRDDTDNPDSVLVKAYVGINERFYLWALKYGEGVEILEPAEVRKGFCENLAKISKMYSV